MSEHRVYPSIGRNCRFWTSRLGKKGVRLFAGGVVTLILSIGFGFGCIERNFSRGLGGESRNTGKETSCIPLPTDVEHDSSSDYYNKRKKSHYYTVAESHAKMLTEDLSREPLQSCLDIGSYGVPFISRFNCLHRYQLSKDYPSAETLPCVEKIQADFLTWSPNQTYTLCTCMQVLEHIPNPRIFVEKIFSICEHIVISVPYLWPPKSLTGPGGHLHDLIDEDTLKNWTSKRDASLQTIVTDGEGWSSKRLVVAYDNRRKFAVP